MRIRAATILSLLLLAALAGCGDGPTHPSHLAPGTFVGRWDGAEWRGSASAVVWRDTLYFVATRPDPEWFYHEEIRVVVPFRGTGAYTVRAGESWLAKIVGGDAGYFPAATGILLIHEWDAENRTVAGDLELTAPHDGQQWRAQGWFRAPVYARFQDVPPIRRN